MTLAPLLDAVWPIQLHALAALSALVLGTVQLSLPKGTSLHRTLGWIWVLLMLLVAAGSLLIHTIRQLGPFSLIHLLSLYVLVTVPMAVLAARRGRIRQHRSMMLGLFVFGLVVAGLFTLLPGRIMHHVVFGS